MPSLLLHRFEALTDNLDQSSPFQSGRAQSPVFQLFQPVMQLLPTRAGQQIDLYMDEAVEEIGEFRSIALQALFHAFPEQDW